MLDACNLFNLCSLIYKIIGLDILSSRKVFSKQLLRNVQGSFGKVEMYQLREQELFGHLFAIPKMKGD